MKHLLSIVLVLVMAVPVFALDVVGTSDLVNPPVVTPIVTLPVPVVPVVPVTPEVKGFTITSPMETNVVGFYFPGDGALAAGLSQTFMRVSHSSIPKLSLDLDATLAQEVNENKDTLAGIGVKLNYNTQKTAPSGFVFIPSLGVTALTDLAKGKAMSEIAQNFRIAIYGSILLYKW